MVIELLTLPQLTSVMMMQKYIYIPSKFREKTFFLTRTWKPSKLIFKLWIGSFQAFRTWDDCHNILKTKLLVNYLTNFQISLSRYETSYSYMYNKSTDFTVVTYFFIDKNLLHTVYTNNLLTICFLNIFNCYSPI